MLLTCMVLIVVMGLAAGMATQSWTSLVQRNHEKELLFRGESYVRAIQSYYSTPPKGVAPEFPHDLEDLVLDRRGPANVRHLRQLYSDPLTGEPFAVIRGEDGRIRGVRSTSSKTAFRTDAENLLVSMNGSTYQEWHFKYVPPKSPTPQTGSSTSSTPTGTAPAATPAATETSDGGSSGGGSAANRSEPPEEHERSGHSLLGVLPEADDAF